MGGQVKNIVAGFSVDCYLQRNCITSRLFEERCRHVAKDDVVDHTGAVLLAFSRLLVLSDRIAC